MLAGSNATATVYTYPSSDVPKRIPPSGNIGTTYSNLTVPDSIIIEDVDVKLYITHTWDSDLDVYLIHGGVTVELFTDVGGSGNDFRDTVLDDEAPISILSGFPPFTGRYGPEGRLSDFDGMNAQGTWQLKIVDDAGQDYGNLQSWSIIIESEICEPPAEPNNPDPCDGEVNVPVDTWLSWNGGPGGPGACVVVPNANTSVEGNSNNGYPFNLVSSMRYQQIYDAAEVGQSGVITEIRFRPDDFFGDSFSSANMDVEIFLGYAATSVLAPSGTFANNIGPGYVKVYDGILTLSSNDVGGPPRNFDIIVDVDDVFDYNPANGPLLLDIKLYNSPGSTQFDAAGSGAHTATTRIWSISIGSPTGVIHFSGPGSDPYGLVTMFCFDGATPLMESRDGVTAVHVRDPNTYEVDLETGTMVSSAASQAASQTDITTNEVFQTTQHKNLSPLKPATSSGAGAVLWDLTHGIFLDYGPSGDYSSLVSILTGKGFTVSTTTLGVNNIDLSVYDVLVVCLGSAWYTTYSPSEIAAIETFVSNGGGLLIMGDNTNCPNSRINPVAQAFGITCGISSLSDCFSNFASHPIFAGCSQICYVAAGALSAAAPSQLVAWAGASGAVAAGEQGGRIVATGDINFCDNHYIMNSNNQLFTENIFDWLSQAQAVPPTTWDVYFGTDPCSLELICENVNEPNCDPTPGPGDLNECTTYYWQVVAKNRCNDVNVGEVWSFTTEGICNRDPNCRDAVPSITELWSPNHKWVEIEILDVNDPDPCDIVSITITGITQDEPVVDNGSGRTFPDGDGIGTSVARLRAERSGRGNGRIYEISFEANDGKGGSCTGSVNVCVPHDEGKGRQRCIDDGQIYDSAASEFLHADLNKDGIVNHLDFAILSEFWLLEYTLD